MAMKPYNIFPDNVLLNGKYRQFQTCELLAVVAAFLF
jgi:hypothetical protein